MKTALISVSDKTDSLAFAQALHELGYIILSTGGTLQHLKEGGVAVTSVSEYTGSPEILNGRVKTLHPKIHGGILAKRNLMEHMTTLEEKQIAPIDIVVVNLYPFFEKAQKDIPLEELVEFIDIGGPTMLRAAAKSFFDVTVITEAQDYQTVLTELQSKGSTQLATRKKLAAKVFNLTSAYDAAIAQLLLEDEFPTFLNAAFRKKMDLRYGENPHQAAAFYESITQQGALRNFAQHQGKALSFNNIRDLDLAWKVVCEFSETACCAVKHSTPCGVALDADLATAYQKAHDCDPISIFGGIVAFNQKVTADVAQKLNEIFLEIVVAPDFEEEALEAFKKKKNLRVIQIQEPKSDQLQWVKVDGGMLVQTVDNVFSQDLKVVSEKPPTNEQMSDLVFAQRVIKHVKSNAIVVAQGKRALGVGTGETNRIWAAKQAIERATTKETENLVLASDAFFPFRDVVDTAAESGIVAIIQPGGSIRDEDSVAAANEHNIAMVTTGVRHFLH